MSDHIRGNRPDANPRPGTNIRIGDVARFAGVSTATVSRALSQPDLVSAKTRGAVLEAVAETGYKINFAARNLRRRQTGGIVVLVPHLSNPFFSSILSGIAEVISQAGLNMLVADTKEATGADRQIVGYLHNNRADGLIVLDGNLPDRIFDGNDINRPPVVFACEWTQEQDQLSVTVDNRHGAMLAVNHLIELGHCRIGHVVGPPDNVLAQTRAAGTREALASAGLAVNAPWFFDADFTLSSGISAAQRWLELDERPTGVFCSSDAMACGFMSELNRRGIRVPNDVSVVGFDDIDIAEHFIPSLTTIRQPRRKIGETAAQMLLALMPAVMARNTESDRDVESTVLPVELVVRESTAPLLPISR